MPLRRVGPDLFEDTTGQQVQIVAVAQNNDGVAAAAFRYPTTLPPQQILGHPGCTINVVQPVTMFGCVVVFASPAPLNAQYDLFEVINGALVPLGVSLQPASGPLVQFRIRGAVVVLAAARRRRRRPAARKRVARGPARRRRPAAKRPRARARTAASRTRKTTRRKTTRKPTRKPTRKTTRKPTRKPARRRTTARKRR